jgi:hypothetical protein
MIIKMIYKKYIYKMEFSNTLFSYDFAQAKELYDTESKLYIDKYCDGGHGFGVNYKINELIIYVCKFESLDNLEWLLEILKTITVNKIILENYFITYEYLEYLDESIKYGNFEISKYIYKNYILENEIDLNEYYIINLLKNEKILNLKIIIDIIKEYDNGTYKQIDLEELKKKEIDKNIIMIYQKFMLKKK